MKTYLKAKQIVFRNGDILKNAAILVENGRVLQVGANLPTPSPGQLTFQKAYSKNKSCRSATASHPSQKRHADSLGISQGLTITVREP